MISTVPETKARLSPVNHDHAVSTLQHIQTHTHTTRHLYKFNPCSRIVALVPLASSSRSLSDDGDRLGGLWLGRRNIFYRPLTSAESVQFLSLSPLLTQPYATVLPITQLVFFSFSFFFSLLFLSPSFSFILLSSSVSYPCCCLFVFSQLYCFD